MPQQIIAVTVLGDDRPGIVADVTTALADLHGNLEDSTMTLLRGHFAMVVLVRTVADAGSVEAALKPLTAGGSLVINARVLAESTTTAAVGPAYSLRVHGADRPGIVATVTRIVAQHGANIVDLGTRLGGNLYVMTAELQVPDEHAAVALERDLTGAAAELGVEVHLSPVDDDVW